MKKIVLLSIFSLGTLLIWAQEVPDSISQKFRKDYPGVTGQSWEIQDNRYRVTYRDPQDMEQSVIYDRTGEVYSRSSEVPSASVPSSVSDYYTKKYPGEKKYRVYREIDQAGVNSYYIDRKGERIYFNNEGQFRNVTPMSPGSNRSMNPK